MPSGQLNGGDPEAPYVSLRVVARHLLHHFRRHPARCPHKRLPIIPPLTSFHQPRTHPKVRQLHRTVGVDQDIACLDIPEIMTLFNTSADEYFAATMPRTPVYLAVLVEVGKSLERLLQDSCDDGLLQALWRQAAHNI